METENCSICLENLKFKCDCASVVIHTACNHLFHYACWKKHWDTGIDIKIDCPMCRTRLNYDGSILTDTKYIKELEEYIENNNGQSQEPHITDETNENVNPNPFIELWNAIPIPTRSFQYPPSSPHPDDDS